MSVGYGNENTFLSWSLDLLIRFFFLFDQIRGKIGKGNSGSKEEKKLICWFSYIFFNKLPNLLLQVTVTSSHLDGQLDTWKHYVAM